MAQTTLREYLQVTEDAINSGRVNEAFTNCQYVLSQFPELLEARRLLGEIYLKQGQLEEAQQTFDWVLTNDPENVVAYCSRALICEQLQDYDTALDCYQQAYELSRGISHIRQEFNQLSEKVGQPGFIFSRAGLARLYMRGDLLSQAVQEWESVLSSAPDRLDARTGLLETYWREGLYDRVEQLAKQILNTVPLCLKALVLLAHVTFAQDAQHAQELMLRAQALDPDLIIARELFSDFMVSHSKDPFLTLLKQSPAVLVSEEQSEPEAQPVTARIAQVAAATNGTYEATSTFSDPLGRWSSLDNLIEPQQEHQTLQEEEPLGSRGSNTPAELGSWNSYARVTDTQGETAPPSETEDQATGEANIQSEQTSAEQERPWYHMDMFEGSTAENWDNDLPPMEAGDIASPWETDEQDTDIPAPPAWLDMLTKGERHQSAENLAGKTGPAALPRPAANLSSTEATQTQEHVPEFAEQAPGIAPQDSVTPAVSQSTEDDEEDFFFGPAWLKSLGAAVLESPDTTSQEASVLAPLSSPTEPAVSRRVEASKPLTPPVPEAPQEPAAPASPPETEISASSWLYQAAVQLSANDQKLLTTLEDLEKDLRSRGFTPLEPGALSTLAQPRPEEPSLSSALAQLGNLEAQAPAPAEQTGQPQTKAVAAQPLWSPTPDPLLQEPAQSGGTSPQPPTSEPMPAPVNHPDVLSQPSPAPADASGVASSPIPGGPGPDQGFQASNPPDLTPTPAPTHSILPADMELETTMKRPAVRLQSMQQRSATKSGANAARSHLATSRPAESGLSNKERLLKGYQYQLAGSYDDAMQEYRIIIRNAPDLLGEVISNMRALLKLAPKYSAGYRVLGDAYMRQGEYLQAMEAYNKALTMAKKTKS